MRTRVVVAFFLTLGVLGGSLLLGIEAGKYATDQGQKQCEEVGTLIEMMRIIESNYAEEVEQEKLVHSAAKGLTKALDKHSSYLDPATYKQFLEDNQGKYSGIGIRIQPHPDGGLYVMELIPGGPAEETDLQTGDRIVSVDATDVTSFAMTDIVDMIKGTAGDPVTIGVLRKEEPLDFTIVRRSVKVDSVHAEWLGNGVGYIHVSTFQKETTKDLHAELEAFNQNSDDPLNALILDLRQNGGGLFTEAVAMVDLFVDSGKIVATTVRGGRTEREYSAKSGLSHNGWKLDAKEAWAELETLIVLVDERSASASEIVAGALQDLDRAQVLGVQSYGKGSVQSIQKLKQGGGIKITIGRYQLPSGRFIDKDGGVSPDIPVTYYEDDQNVNALFDALDEVELSQEQRVKIAGIVEGLREKRKDPQPYRFQAPVRERIQWDPQLKKALEVAQNPTP